MTEGTIEWKGYQVSWIILMPFYLRHEDRIRGDLGKSRIPHHRRPSHKQTWDLSLSYWDLSWLSFQNAYCLHVWEGIRSTSLTKQCAKWLKWLENWCWFKDDRDMFAQIQARSLLWTSPSLCPSYSLDWGLQIEAVHVLPSLATSQAGTLVCTWEFRVFPVRFSALPLASWSHRESQDQQSWVYKTA